MNGGPVAVELARHQWDEGTRAVERARADPAASRRLSRQIEIVTAELSRRVGQVFTVAELVGVYAGADRWVAEAIHEALPDGAGAEVSTAADAAFGLYARRAADYAP